MAPEGLPVWRPRHTKVQTCMLWLPIATVLGGFCFATVALTKTPATDLPHVVTPSRARSALSPARQVASTLRALTSSKDDEGRHARVCAGWCAHIPPGQRKPKCAVHGAERLRLALQDENCATAMRSSLTAKAMGGKITKLVKGGEFSFFRGAAGFFYTNMLCEGPLGLTKSWGEVPQVISNGDAHPENFGSMLLGDGAVMWGVNDYDQAFRAPFIWDLQRGATGFIVACEAARAESKAEKARAADALAAQTAFSLSAKDRAPHVKGGEGGVVAARVRAAARGIDAVAGAALRASLDVKTHAVRGATRQEIGDRPCGEHARSFISGYMDAVLDGNKRRCEFLVDDIFISATGASAAVPLIDAFLDRVQRNVDDTGARARWLSKYVNPLTLRFLASKKLAPLPQESEELAAFQAVVEAYLYDGVKVLAAGVPEQRRFFTVLDVARANGGTGSIGLARYWVLLEGSKPSDVSGVDGGALDSPGQHHVILEIKQEVDSVLERYAEVEISATLEGKRAADGERAADPYGNMFFGWVSFNGDSFIVRERSLAMDDIDIWGLSADGFEAYAAAAGRAQALYHMRVTCNDVSCKLSDPAMVDAESCAALGAYFGEHPQLRAELQLFAEQEAKRESKAHAQLSRWVADLEKAKRDPVAALNAPPRQARAAEQACVES